jgi:hypothetical protein
VLGALEHHSLSTLLARSKEGHLEGMIVLIEIPVCLSALFDLQLIIQRKHINL